MLAQLIALLAAISYALSFILSKRRLRYSTVCGTLAITFAAP
jgi:hypothetical protein